MINKAYIKIENIKERNVIEELLYETFADITIIWNDNVGKITTDNVESFSLQLKKMSVLTLQDVGIKTSILIVPFFDDLFIKYLSLINNDVLTAFEVFLKNISLLMVKEDSKNILNKIKSKDLDTLKAFLSCNCNSCITANELFLHRNSLNYRINLLENDLDISIRDINTIMFLNLVINICA